MNHHLAIQLRRISLAIALAAFPICATAQTDAKPDGDKPESIFSERSPWMLAPVFNKNPKLGTAVGAIGGYIHFFDASSHPSIFAVTGQYSSTDSIVTGAFARASWDEDHQRLIASLLSGNVKNDYADYLGSGVPLQNDATLKSAIARYTYRVTGDWFLGGQAIYQNFAVGGQTEFDEQVLDILGIVPFKSAGAGLVVQNDTRDDENMPTRGRFLNFNNMAFREGLGGDNNYDVLRADFKFFIPNGDNNVFAIRQMNHLTRDAPGASRATVYLRGYKIGQFTGEYSSSIEGEQRFRLAQKWTATVFAGVGCLYGGSQKCTSGANLFPMLGAGVQYVLKPQAGVVMNLEYAQGKENNRALLLKMGYGF